MAFLHLLEGKKKRLAEYARRFFLTVPDQPR